jgi:hypothetical protein
MVWTTVTASGKPGKKATLLRLFPDGREFAPVAVFDDVRIPVTVPLEQAAIGQARVQRAAEGADRRRLQQRQGQGLQRHGLEE